MKNVILTDHTVGKTNQDVKAGSECTVVLHDENGLSIQRVGIVEHILDEENEINNQ